MGNDNSSAINFGPFQDTDFECTITGTMQAPVSFPFLPRQSDLVTFSCTMRSPGTECPRPKCTARSSVVLSRPDLMAVGLMEMLKQLQPPLDQDSYQKLCQILSQGVYLCQTSMHSTATKTLASSHIPSNPLYAGNGEKSAKLVPQLSHELRKHLPTMVSRPLHPAPTHPSSWQHRVKRYRARGEEHRAAWAPL